MGDLRAQMAPETLSQFWTYNEPRPVSKAGFSLRGEQMSEMRR